MKEYRVTFSVQRRQDGGDDFEEIGFGTSFDHATVDPCAGDVHALIQRREWETTGDMPDPKEVDEEAT